MCHVPQRSLRAGLYHVLYASEIIAHRFTSCAIYFRDHCTQVYIMWYMLNRLLHTRLHHVPYISEINAHVFTSHVVFQRSLHGGLHHVPYASEIIGHRFTLRVIRLGDHYTQVLFALIPNFTRNLMLRGLRF